MIESLLPLLFLPFSQPAEPTMVPTHVHTPIQWEEPMPMMEEMPQKKVKRMRPMHTQHPQMQWQRPLEIRRKGYQLTNKNYFTKRLEHAVQSGNPNFPTSDLSQRTHREFVRTNRRGDRMIRDFTRGCAFPCRE